jgi:hypothetical protein
VGISEKDITDIRVENIDYRIDGNVVEFTNPDGEIGEWNFGDGTTSTEVNPVHVYDQHGTFIVLIGEYYGLVNLRGHVIPSAGFTYTFDELDTNVVSFVATGGVRYEFIIDGVTYDSSDGLFVHTFPEALYYTVYVVAFDEYDNAGVSSQEIDIKLRNILPVITGGYVRDELLLEYDFEAIDPDKLSKIPTYVVDFGDGTTSINRTGSHTYPAPTTPLDPAGQFFTFTITATDERGGVSTYTEELHVFDFTTYGNNILTNGDFETDDISEWSFSNLSRVVKEDEGRNVLYIVPTYGSTATATVPVSLVPGKTYEISCIMKGTNVSGLSGRIPSFLMKNVATNKYDFNVGLTVYGQYETITVTYKPEIGETEFLLSVNAREINNNEVWIDEISIRERY